jgi:hypothetical protein
VESCLSDRSGGRSPANRGLADAIPGICSKHIRLSRLGGCSFVPTLKTVKVPPSVVTVTKPVSRAGRNHRGQVGVGNSGECRCCRAVERNCRNQQPEIPGDSFYPELQPAQWADRNASDNYRNQLHRRNQSYVRRSESDDIPRSRPRSRPVRKQQDLSTTPSGTATLRNKFHRDLAWPCEPGRTKPGQSVGLAILRELSRDGTNPIQACQSPVMPQKQSGS